MAQLVKNSPAMSPAQGDLGSVPELKRFPGEGKGYPPLCWPGEFHGVYSSWGHKEFDTTE